MNKDIIKNKTTVKLLTLLILVVLLVVIILLFGGKSDDGSRNQIDINRIDNRIDLRDEVVEENNEPVLSKEEAMIESDTIEEDLDMILKEEIELDSMLDDLEAMDF
jgi:hypothetical protein